MGRHKNRSTKRKADGSASKGVTRNQPSISLCMIVRDEEASLPRCLSSVRDHVDEIVIVDTGSKDRTIEFAKRFGAKVYEHPWESNFGKHRNQSIAYATGDWILIMDADEEFVREDAAKLRGTVRDTKADYLLIRCQDVNRHGVVQGFFNQVRLFKNHLGMRYVRNIHNQLATVGNGEYTRLAFRHYGYDLSAERMEEKHRRTTSLLLERISSDPDNPYDHFELAASYSMHREPEKAIQAGEIALDLRRKRDLRDSYFVTAFYIVAQGYLALENLDMAEKTALEALQFFDLNLDACYVLAAVAFKRGDLASCRNYCRRYLELRRLLEESPEKMKAICFTSYGLIYDIHLSLAQIAFAEKDYAKARELFLKGFEEENRPVHKAIRISDFYIDEGHEEDALEWACTAYGLGHKDTALFGKMRRFWREREGLQRAAHAFKKVALEHPDLPTPWRILGDLEAALSNIAQAVACYEKSLSLDPGQKDVYAKLGLCRERRGDLEAALSAYETMHGLDPYDVTALLRAGGVLLLMGNLREAAQRLDAAPETALGKMERIEKGLLCATLNWAQGDIELFIRDLDIVMSGLGMPTERTVDTLDELGEILFAVSRRLCSTNEWRMAQISLRLGAMIAPGTIDPSSLRGLMPPPDPCSLAPGAESLG